MRVGPSGFVTSTIKLEYSGSGIVSFSRGANGRDSCDVDIIGLAEISNSISRSTSVAWAWSASSISESPQASRCRLKFFSSVAYPSEVLKRSRGSGMGESMQRWVGECMSARMEIM